MKNRLFDVVDNTPIVNPVLINLGPFKRLWESDKTDVKSNYVKYLLYIYYMGDPHSPYFESKNKEDDICLEVWGRRDYKVPIKVKDALAEYLKRNATAESRALEAAIIVCDEITQRVNKTSKDSGQFDELIRDIDIEISKSKDDISRRIELTKEKMDLLDSNLELAKKSSDMIPKIKSQVESMIELRKKVEQSLSELDSSNKRVENFMVDDFIREHEIDSFESYND